MNEFVSVIIPTKNSEKFLENCLKSIKKQKYKYIEIVVVDNNSTDSTKKIARRYTDLVFNKGPERSSQRNFGATKSSGKYLFFVDSDMEVSRNVIRQCVDKIKKLDVGGIIIPEESFGTGFWATCKKLERSFYLNNPLIEAARFIEKKVFEEYKGYDEILSSAEDWDLHKRISQKYKIARITGKIFHNESKLNLYLLLSKKFYYGKKIKEYSKKPINNKTFLKQASILYRYKLFLSHPKKLFSNPFVGLGLLFMITSEFTIAAIGYFMAILQISTKNN